MYRYGAYRFIDRLPVEMQEFARRMFDDLTEYYNAYQITTYGTDFSEEDPVGIHSWWLINVDAKGEFYDDIATAIPDIDVRDNAINDALSGIIAKERRLSNVVECYLDTKEMPIEISTWRINPGQDPREELVGIVWYEQNYEIKVTEDPELCTLGIVAAIAFAFLSECYAEALSTINLLLDE